VPRDQFIVAGKAWNLCREGKKDPQKFGMFDMHGLWFIRGNLVRDIAALNKVPLLPWDSWGLADRQDDDLSNRELDLLDQIASQTWDEIEYQFLREIYQTQEGFAVPAIIKSYTQSGALEIELDTENVI
jgi:hypothetical protein